MQQVYRVCKPYKSLRAGTTVILPVVMAEVIEKEQPGTLKRWARDRMVRESMVRRWGS